MSDPQTLRERVDRVLACAAPGYRCHDDRCPCHPRPARSL